MKVGLRLLIGLNIAEQKIRPLLLETGGRLAGIRIDILRGIIKGECSIARAKAGIILILLVAVVGDAEFQGVFSFRPSKGVEVVVILVEVPIGTERKQS